MIKNVNTADLLAKLTLAALTILFYFMKVIHGPFATLLVTLSAIVLMIYLIKLVKPCQ